MGQCPKNQSLQCPIGPTPVIIYQTSAISSSSQLYRIVILLITKLLLLPIFQKKTFLLKIILHRKSKIVFNY